MVGDACTLELQKRMPDRMMTKFIFLSHALKGKNPPLLTRYQDLIPAKMVISTCCVFDPLAVLARSLNLTN